MDTQTTTHQDETTAEVTYSVPSWLWEEADKRVERANRRLERAGIAERFAAVWGPDTPIEDEHGRTHLWRTLTLDRPAISFGGWEFAATLDRVGDGVVARTVPGTDLGGWRPTDLTCDHCGHRRQRTSTYVVRDSDGAIKQVGHNCLNLFLGVKPVGLWALEHDIFDDTEREAFSSGGGGEREVHSPLEIIATALALSDGGTGWVSRDRALYTGLSSTTGATRDFLHGPAPRKVEDIRRHEEIAAQAQTYLADGTVEAVVASVRQAEVSDFVTNVLTLLDADWIEAKHVGLTAAAVTIHTRAQRDLIEREQRAARPQPASGFLGEPKEKIGPLEVTVTVVRSFTDAWGGAKTFLIMETADRHTIKWMASKDVDVDQGDRRLLTATVKAQDTYRDVDQTVVIRATLAPVPETDESEQAA